MAQGASAGGSRWLAAAVVAASAVVVTGSGPAVASRPSAAAAAAAGHARAAVMSVTWDTDPGHALAPGFAAPGVNKRDYQICLKGAGTLTPAQSAYQAGYADAAKVGEAIGTGFPVVGTAFTSGRGEGIAANTNVIADGHVFSCTVTSAHLDYRGRPELPPVRVTLLAFGVEPVTATAIISQLGAHVTRLAYQDQGRVGHIFAGTPVVAVVTARLGLRLTDVTVNGTKLDVGPDCHAAGSLRTPGNPVAPGQVMLVGGTRRGDPLPHDSGLGAVAGQVSIPPFTGCRTPSGENLDPLLTAAASGPGNYVKMMVSVCQAPGVFTLQQCTSNSGLNTAPLFTVTHGGRFSASGPLTLTDTKLTTTLTITCSASAISGVFPDTSGPPRGALASMTLTGIAGCTGDDGSTWHVTQHGPVFFDPVIGFAGTDTTAGSVDDLSLVLTGTGTGAPGTCRAVLDGFEFVTYTNSGSVLSIQPADSAIAVEKSSCPDVLRSDNGIGGFGADLSATYNLLPGGTKITIP